MNDKNNKPIEQEDKPVDFAILNGVLSDDFSLYMNPPIKDNNSLIAKYRY